MDEERRETYPPPISYLPRVPLADILPADMALQWFVKSHWRTFWAWGCW